MTIVTYSKMLQMSLQAAEQLAQEGIEAEIVDLRSLRPLDMGPVLDSFRRTNRAVIVEEGWRSFGVGAEVAARIYEEAFDYVDAPIRARGPEGSPLPYNRDLEQAALPQVADVIARRATRCCNGRLSSTMPKLGFDMAEGTLVRWVSGIGETVQKGEVLAEIETDKATVEVEAVESEVVRKHLVQEGVAVPIGTPIAIIGTADEPIDDVAVPAPTASRAGRRGGTSVVGPGESPAGRGGRARCRPACAPLPWRAAWRSEASLDLRAVYRQRPGRPRRRRRMLPRLSAGRRPFRRPDRLSPRPACSLAQRRTSSSPPRRLRQAISRRMTASKQQVPHFYLTADLDAAQLVRMRAEANAALPEDTRLSIHDFVLRAAALALRCLPGAERFARR